MPQDILPAAREQADQSDSPVKAAGWCGPHGRWLPSIRRKRRVYLKEELRSQLHFLSLTAPRF
jgi:hypothetical protein